MPYIPVAVVNSGGGSGAGSFTLIEDQLLGSAATFDFLSIPGTYTHLRLIWQARATNSAAVTVGMRFNNDTGTNYDNQIFAANGSSIAGNALAGSTSNRVGTAAGTGSGTSRTGWGTIDIINYAATTWFKTYRAAGGRSEDTAGEQHLGDASGTWRSTSAITRVTLIPDAGSTFEIGSRATLYGLT
jgi:hypothetical protein